MVAIVSLLAAMAIPRLANLSNDTQKSARNESVNRVRTGHAEAIASLKALPTLSQLLNYVAGPDIAIAAGNQGVDIGIDGTTYTVGTYSDTDCTVATSDAADPVGCIGNVVKDTLRRGSDQDSGSGRP